MDIEQITPPSESDVLSICSVNDFKANERLTHTVHDADLIPDVIKQAYAALDGRHGWLNRSILPQGWRLWLPGFQSVTELPYGPVSAIDSVKYYDAAGTLQTLSASAYEVGTGAMVPVLTRASDASWPSVDQRARAVQINYTAGFGAPDVMDFRVKQSLKRAILLLASHYYRNPAATYGEPRAVLVNREVSFGLKHLVGFLRIPSEHK